MIKMQAIWLGGALMLVLSSCSALTPHENFRAHMESNVGSSIDKPREPGVALPRYLLGSKTLLNGNIENEYRDRGTCRYYFEYNPLTRIIVNWRFEGSEKDCVIAP
jgi:hypothetical protein